MSRFRALPVLLAGAFIVVLDFFVVNVALPAIASDLDASEAALEWVVAGYGLAFAVLLITAGRLGDELGRRRVFLVGIGLFTVTSLGCGIAPDATTLVLARIAQGASAAFVMPQVLSTIAVTYSGADHERALSAYGLVLGLAAVGGQLVGGLLLELDVAGLGWRACFLINVPIGLVALAVGPRLLPESRTATRRPVGLPSAAVLALGLGALLLPLVQGRQHGWPLWTWLSLGAAAVVLAALITGQRRLAARGGRPLLDVGLAARRSFSAGLATQLALASVQAAFFVFLALYLQQGRGLGALEAGLVFSIVAVSYVATSAPAPALAARHGRRIIALGGGCLVAGTATFAAALGAGGQDVGLLALVVPMLLVGAGIGLCLTPIQQVVLSGVEPERVGAASGMLATTQQFGFALGVAISGIVFFGALDDGTGRAFELTLWQLALFSVEVAALAALLPARRNTAPAEPEPEPVATVA
jgi:EmrB/QacA subfamily drug resistance transporter